MFCSDKKKELSLYTLRHCHLIEYVALRDLVYFKLVRSSTLAITTASVQFSAARDDIKAQRNCGLAVGQFQQTLLARNEYMPEDFAQ